MSKGINLEKRIVQRLERTGFARNVVVYADNFEVYTAPGRMGVGNKEDMLPYISFDITEKKIGKDCRDFTDYILERLKRTKPEIVGVVYVVNRKERKLNAYLVLNPAIDVYDRKDFIRESLNALNTALKSYSHDHDIADQVRD